METEKRLAIRQLAYEILEQTLLDIQSKGDTEEIYLGDEFCPKVMNRSRMIDPLRALLRDFRDSGSDQPLNESTPMNALSSLFDEDP